MNARPSRLLLPIPVAALALILLWIGAEMPGRDSTGSLDAAARPWKSWNPNGVTQTKPDPWFYRQRAFPYSEIPEGARRAAFAEARTLRELQATSRRSSGAWTESGPTNVGGRVTSIAVDPTDWNTVYMGAAAGGVFQSTDGGSSWDPVFEETPSIGDLAVDPLRPEIVFVGTGEANAAGDTYAGDGVWRSTDAGASWENVGLEATAKIGRIAIDPVDSDRILVAAMGRLFGTNPERGIYRSTDGGETWAQTLFVNDSTGAVDVAIDPSNPDIVYAATWERVRRPWDRRVGGTGSGVHKSTDGGDTWTLLGPGNGLPGPSPDRGRIGLAIAASEPSTVYAYYCDDPGYFDGVYKTTNSGGTWSRVNDGSIDDVTASFGWYFGQIRVDPNDPDRVFVLGVPMYRTTSGGNSWSGFGESMHVDHHALVIDPNDSSRMYAGNDGGFYRTNTGGASWAKVGPQPITQFYAITVDPQRPERLYGGTQDNSTPRTLTGALDDWDVIYFGDGFYTLVDPRDSDVIYAEYQYGGLGKSTDGGDSWDDATDGIPGSDRRNWSTPVAMDPSDPDVLYYGTFRVFRSANGAASWSAISPDLTDGSSPGSLVFGTITTLDVAPSDPDAILAGTDDGNVWVTYNGGGVWTPVSSALPDRWITRVAFDPEDEMIAYVTVSGYRRDEYLPHVFRTSDGGASWMDISSNLPSIPLNDIIVDPSDTDRLYVAADDGVYWSSDQGASWSPLGGGLPPVPVHDLEFHGGNGSIGVGRGDEEDTGRKLVAGTHGRSMYTYDLDQIVTSADLPGIGEPLTVRVAPNPTRSATTVSFALPEPTRLSAAVYDVQGRLVRSLAEGLVEAGPITLEWDGRDDRGQAAPSGVYFSRVETDAGGAVGRIVLRR